jgi:hypothetical protein
MIEVTAGILFIQHIRSSYDIVIQKKSCILNCREKKEITRVVYLKPLVGS